ncbi:hypothetical protein RTG_00908 [Rhodotorula toruloides ATCC 204091]|uniref:Atos-like conserved domain-containing protein n=1 Tax=Rhodotorula toruloides TaxID=5286 RepID=A0A0K3CEC6_RHOTO|nr:hypothetical protein RTG_00908 [Rhodotorula toruloides ATCC 204091]KAK4334355.1 DUF4210 domain-containing protein [Rhodotorula toruloides]PRQ75096.1 protein of unknown function (DUF4210)-domain containing protein [Rhodotorula toruloides]
MQTQREDLETAEEVAWRARKGLPLAIDTEPGLSTATRTFSASLSPRSYSSGSPTIRALSPRTEPIAISSSSSTFSAVPRTPRSYDSAASFAGATPLDGPLTELMPALSISASISSSGDSFRSPPQAAPSSWTSGPRRRVASGPSFLVSSPPRSSPLSRSVGPYDDSGSDEDAPWRHFRPPAAVLFGQQPGESARDDLLVLRQSRRRSSISLSSSVASATPCASFVGSFEDSLLSGRMSSRPSPPFPFVASIGVLGSSDAPLRLRCPAHLHIPFEAVFYPSSGEAITSPYVGTVDIEGHYFSLLSAPSASSDSRKIPKFPGYQVPARGQIQLVLKNSQQTAFKPFLIPYDLSGLERGGAGGRTFLRQKSYSVEGTDDKGKLRFAVHLVFCSPPASSSKKSGKDGSTPKYYLYRSIRLVFASRGLDLSDKLRVVHEGPAQAGGNALGLRMDGDFGDYAGPGAEWDLARKKAKERLKVLAAQDAIQTTTSATAYPAPTPHHDTPDQLYPSSTVSLASAASVSAFPTSVVVPPPAPHSIVSSTRTSPPRTLLDLPSSPLDPAFAAPLTFDRVPSPRPALTLRDRTTSQSGLSASRPPSRLAHERSQSRDREVCGR